MRPERGDGRIPLPSSRPEPVAARDPFSWLAPSVLESMALRRELAATAPNHLARHVVDVAFLTGA